MPDPQTINVLLAVPVRGSNVGVWDTPVNNDFSAIDGLFAGVVSVALASSPVTLTSPSGSPAPGAGPTQAQNSVIRFSGTLTANVTVTLPFPGPLIIDNGTTGNFVVTLRAGTLGQVIGVPQGNVRRIYNDGTNVKFADLPDVGSYWDYIGTGVPSWVAACTVPPFLLCNGGAFSGVTYPYLASVLGGTTLPDMRGRARFFLNGGTGRITTAGSGIDGDTRNSAGGDQDVTIAQGNLPAATLITTITDPGHVHTGFGDSTQSGSGASRLLPIGSGGAVVTAVASNTTGITASTALGGSGTALAMMPPAVIGGITMIRAG